MLNLVKKLAVSSSFVSMGLLSKSFNDTEADSSPDLVFMLKRPFYTGNCTNHFNKGLLFKEDTVY